MPPGRSLFFVEACMVKHHPFAASRTWPTRLALALAVMLPTGALSGGCSTVNRSVAPSVAEATGAFPSGAVVRAQDDERGARRYLVGTSRERTLRRLRRCAGSHHERGIQPPPSTSATPGAVMDPLSVAFESLFGEASTSEWSPLSFSSLFTEGWNQPFVFSPASDSGRCDKSGSTRRMASFTVSGYLTTTIAIMWTPREVVILAHGPFLRL